jgi:peptidyl-prolyl cis-trans isomerase C
MLNKTSLRRSLLSLGLSLLLAGWVACKPAADKEETAAKDAGATAATPGQTDAPGSQPAGVSAPGSSAPGQTAPGQPAGGATTSANPNAKPLAPKDLPAVVAKVNGENIKKEDLLQGAQAVQIRLAQEGRPAVPSVEFYREVLNQIIGIALLQQDAKAQGVTATDQEIQQQLAQRKSAFPTEDAFKQALAQAGLTEQKLRDQTRDAIAVQKYIQSRLAKSGAATEQATRDFYDKNKAQIQAPERVHVRHILIRVDPKATAAAKQDARQKAETLLKRIQAGEDFAKLAAENSDDPGSKVRGGDLGFVAKGQAPPPFEAATFALTKPNQLSPVVETPAGYHIIQFVERQPAGAIPYEQVKARIGQLIQQQQGQQQLADRVRELRGKAKIEVFL